MEFLEVNRRVGEQDLSRPACHSVRIFETQSREKPTIRDEDPPLGFHDGCRFRDLGLLAQARASPGCDSLAELPAIPGEIEDSLDGIETPIDTIPGNRLIANRSRRDVREEDWPVASANSNLSPEFGPCPYGG